MTIQKSAVDSKTTDYWSGYFKEYGQMWVRDIPRRIKNAMRRSEKAASIDGKIAPMATKVTPEGGLVIEAAFVGKIDEQDAKVLITAHFNEHGRMINMEPNRII